MSVVMVMVVVMPVIVAVPMIVSGRSARERRDQQVRAFLQAAHSVIEAGRDAVRVAGPDRAQVRSQRHLKLATDRVRSLLKGVRVRGRGDALVEEDLVGLEPRAEDQRALADTLANGFKGLGGHLEERLMLHVSISSDISKGWGILALARSCCKYTRQFSL